MDIFWFIFLFAHVMGDFYLQTKNIAKCKIGKYSSECGTCEKCKNKKGINIGKMAVHVLLYCIPFLILLLFCSWYIVLLYITVIYASHFFVDYVTCLAKKYLDNHILIFILDQLAHLIILYILYVYWFKYDLMIPSWFNFYELIFAKVTLILILILPSSIFINCVFDALFNDNKLENKDLDDKSTENSNLEHNEKRNLKNLSDPGAIIGIVERLIVLCLVIAKAYSALAIIITIKTWARSNDLKTIPGFGNKYLIGTLLSLCIALAIGYWYAQLQSGSFIVNFALANL